MVAAPRIEEVEGLEAFGHLQVALAPLRAQPPRGRADAVGCDQLQAFSSGGPDLKREQGSTLAAPQPVGVTVPWRGHGARKEARQPTLPNQIAIP